MVINGGAEVLEIAAGSALIAAMLGISPTAGGVHVGEPLAAEELVKPTDPLVEFFAVARAGRAQIGIAALIFALFLLQSVFVGVRESAPSVAALHPVNGFLILLLSMVLARRAWVFARASRTTAEAPVPSSTPAAEPGA